jgi:hypothetical protein
MGLDYSASLSQGEPVPMHFYVINRPEPRLRCDTVTAMMIPGHRTRSVFDRYNIVSEDDLREAALKTWTHAQAQSILRKVGFDAGQG